LVEETLAVFQTSPHDLPSKSRTAHTRLICQANHGQRQGVLGPWFQLKCLHCDEGVQARVKRTPLIRFDGNG
jgi:hypothetical protein